VWRVEWNITGTILASSGDDGTVRLWKANFDNEWKSLSIITGEEENESDIK
jgi:nucleoporin SEH1